MPTGHDIAMALRVAYLTMHRRADAVLAPAGVTADQFVLLSLLAEEDGVTQQQLVRRASSDPNTVRAMLLLLEKDGLIARRPHPTDRRARSVSLTAKGRRTFQRISAYSEDLRQQILSFFTPDEAKALIKQLHQFAAAMRQPLTEPGPPAAKPKA